MASTECNQEEINNSEEVNLDYMKKETLLKLEKVRTKLTFTCLKNKK